MDSNLSSEKIAEERESRERKRNARETNSGGSTAQSIENHRIRRAFCGLAFIISCLFCKTSSPMELFSVAWTTVRIICIYPEISTIFDFGKIIM